MPSEEDVVVEEFSSEDLVVPLSPPADRPLERTDLRSSGRTPPSRPVPIPPGRTEEDFPFLFQKKEQAMQSNMTPSDRLRTVRAKNQFRMSVMLHKPLEPSAPPVVSDAVVSPRLTESDSLPVSPRVSMMSPRIGKVSKSERVKDVLARVAGLQKENPSNWSTMPAPVAPSVQRQIDEAVAGRGDWYALVEGLDVPMLWMLAASLLASFPNKDVLLTPTLRDLFVTFAREENPIHRRLSFHSLIYSLPEQNSQLLNAVLAALKTLSTSQLHLVARLMGPLMGDDVVVEALTSEFPLNGDFDGVLTILERNHWVGSVSRNALLNVVFNEA